MISALIERRPVLAMVPVLLAMTSITSGAALAKHMFPLVGPVGVSALRLFFAALILGLAFRPWRMRPTRQDLPLVVFYGASLGIMNLLFYLAIQTIPLGIAVALEFVGPLALGVCSSRHRRDLIWLAVAVIGIGALLPLGKFSADLDLRGMALALLAGAFWAGYIHFGRKAGNALHGGAAVAWGMSIAAVLVFPIGIITQGAQLFSWQILPLALAVGFFSSALPYSLEMISLKRLPTTTFTIIMSMEPAFGALSGWVYLGEQLTLIQWCAIACVMAASVGSTLTAGKAATPAPETPLEE
jgi:inner membrane transporter RhtA